MPCIDDKPERPTFLEGCLPIILALAVFAILALIL